MIKRQGHYLSIYLSHSLSLSLFLSLTCSCSPNLPFFFFQESSSKEWSAIGLSDDKTDIIACRGTHVFAVLLQIGCKNRTRILSWMSHRQHLPFCHFVIVSMLTQSTRFTTTHANDAMVDSSSSSGKII